MRVVRTTLMRGLRLDLPPPSRYSGEPGEHSFAGEKWRTTLKTAFKRLDCIKTKELRRFCNIVVVETLANNPDIFLMCYHLLLFLRSTQTK